MARSKSTTPASPSEEARYAARLARSISFMVMVGDDFEAANRAAAPAAKTLAKFLKPGLSNHQIGAIGAALEQAFWAARGMGKDILSLERLMARPCVCPVCRRHTDLQGACWNRGCPIGATNVADKLLHEKFDQDAEDYFDGGQR